MFRVSRFMEALRDSASVPPLTRRRHGRAAPAVIWHPCLHGHAPSDSGSELDTHEALTLIDQFHTAGVRSLVLSGDEPMQRSDFFRIVAHARELGLRVALSTDGSRLTAMNALKLAAYSIDYVSIQIDGLQPTHNHVRRSRHAYQRALRGLRAARNAGLRVGMRMTLSAINAAELPAIVSLGESEQVDRFHLTQVVPEGAAERMAIDKAPADMTLAALEWLFDHVWKRAQKGDAGNFVTSQHAADSVYLLYWMITRMPDRMSDWRKRGVRNGNTKHGNALCVDPLGNVHADSTCRDPGLGNVRERPFIEIAAAHHRRP